MIILSLSKTSWMHKLFPAAVISEKSQKLFLCAQNPGFGDMDVPKRRAWSHEWRLSADSYRYQNFNAESVELPAVRRPEHNREKLLHPASRLPLLLNYWPSKLKTFQQFLTFCFITWLAKQCKHIPLITLHPWLVKWIHA